MTKIKDTSGEYETMLGVRDTKSAPGSLAGLLGISDTPADEKEAWRKLWVGMPTFDNKKVVGERELTIKFLTEDLFNEFVEKNGFKTITKKTKSIFWPEVPREENSLFRFIDGDE